MESPRFNGSNYPAWKLKMHAILIKDGCVFALKGKENKSEGITDKCLLRKTSEYLSFN